MKSREKIQWCICAAVTRFLGHVFAYASETLTESTSALNKHHFKAQNGFTLTLRNLSTVWKGFFKLDCKSPPRVRNIRTKCEGALRVLSFTVGHRLPKDHLGGIL